MNTRNEWAVCYSVKDEAPLLRSALPYLQAQGCSRVYVYWDGTTDDGPRVIQGSTIATARRSIEPDEFLSPPAWVQAGIPRWSESMDIRKRMNCLDAARRAYADGIEWLVCIDPDELVVPDLHTVPNSRQFESFLAEVPSKVDQIFLPNIEAIPTEDSPGAPFETCTLFTRRLPATEFLLRSGRAFLRKAGASPRLIAQYEQTVYGARFPMTPLRILRDPRNGERIPAGHFLGYMARKTIIRSASGTRSMFNIHQWQPTDTPLRTIQKGWLLHYDLCSAQYLKLKFRQRASSMQVPAFHTRHVIGEIAREPEDSHAEMLFQQCIRIDQRRVDSLLRRRVIQRYTGVKLAFERLQARHDAADRL